MNFYVEFLNGTNEWEVRFNDGYRIWFDGDVDIETVFTRAKEVARRRSA